MNLLETMNVRTESCEMMKRNEAEEQQKKMQSLQDIICKCKKLLNMQAQAMAQKDAKIYQLEKLCQEKDETHTRLIKLKDIEIQNLEWKMKDERSSHQYASYRLREVEEELAREKGKSCWDKFKEKHHLRERKKTYRIPDYNKVWRRKEVIKKLLFGVYCVIWGIVGIALFSWVMGM